MWLVSPNTHYNELKTSEVTRSEMEKLLSDVDGDIPSLWLDRHMFVLEASLSHSVFPTM